MRPGVIAWRPLSDNRRGAGGDEGARHATHVRFGGRPLSKARRGAGIIQGARHATHVRLWGRPVSEIVRASLHGALHGALFTCYIMINRLFIC